MKNIYEEFENLENGWHSEKLGVVDETPVFVRAMKDYEAQFHVHENSDEMFIVIDGELCMDFENESFVLNKGYTFIVKAGTLHRARVANYAHLIIVGGKYT